MMDYDYFDFESDESSMLQDLQLAAELGKNLLARNKELENSVKQCRNIIEEQALEIEYLSKQTTALRKTNDNRIRIYEQLEVSIQELERANQRLALDNSTDKKQIKSLCAYRDTLEARCEELQNALDEARLQQASSARRKSRGGKSSASSSSSPSPSPREGDESTRKVDDPSSPAQKDQKTQNSMSEEDLVNDLLMQNQELKRQKSRDQRKITDLEEEICRNNQDMALLEEELSTLYQREEYMKNLQEEISALEEVRSGNLCGRCLKEVDPKRQQVQMILDPEEEEEEAGGRPAFSDSNSTDMQLENKEDNPYRTLVEKYEALLEEQSQSRRHCHRSDSSNCLSLQDELKPFCDLGSFHHGDGVEHDEESGREDNEEKDERRGGTRAEDKKSVGKRKMFSTTPTDFSEAETSSSGFSDETSNKATQTERNVTPGSFLCSIADGEDCIFSIYDGACPIESRFRKTPEYRTLFREIFAVLKRAAEAKDDGEQLPLLDDLTPIREIPRAPPVTPAKEEAPAGFEEALASAPEAANVEAPKTEDAKDTSTSPAGQTRDARSTNDILEFLSLGIIANKKSHRRSNNSPGRRGKAAATENVEDGDGTPRNSPRRSGGRKRREWRNFESPKGGSRTQSPAIRPHVLTTLERRETPPGNPQQKATSSWGFQPFVSTAAQEVAKLKKLEKSYAEALRQPPKNFTRVNRNGSTSLMK